ncbi:hypothetical protein EV2_037039 [Malus domestica]
MGWTIYQQVVRDENGEFVAAKTMNLSGICSPLLAEILAAREVVDFGRQLAVTQVTFEGDALLVLKALQWDATANNGPCGHSIT